MPRNTVNTMAYKNKLKILYIFYRHKDIVYKDKDDQTLKVIQEQSHVDEGRAEAEDIEDDDDMGGVSGEEEENEIEEVVEARGEGSTFKEAMNVRYQVQFPDQRMRRRCSQRGRSTNNVGEVSNRPRPK